MFCPTCNYPLTHLPTPRCPECGHPFNPQDPKTYNTHPFTRLTHFALQGTGRLTTTTLLLATLAILITTRIPLHNIPFSFIDLQYYGQFWRWPARLKTLTFWDAAYMTGLTLLTLGAAHYLLRTTLRLFATLRHPHQDLNPQRKHHLLTLTALTLCTLFIGYGWPYRIGQRWAADEYSFWRNGSDPNKTQSLEAPLAYPFAWMLPITRPVAWPSVEQREEVLGSMVRQGWSARDRITALRLINSLNIPLSEEVFQHESDPSVRAAAVQMLAMDRPDHIMELSLALLDDSSAEVRAAAIDAIGSLNDPRLISTYRWSVPDLNTSPSIPVARRAPRTLSPPKPFPPDLHARLQKTMLQGQSPQERQAAARALLPFPPKNPNLRWSEWGVWIARDASLKPVRPADADIPPFVHTTGDSADSLKRYTNPFYDVTKPIVHISADLPLVIDAQVKIRTGRTLYAYPQPDDYAITAWMGMTGPGWRGPKTNPLNQFDTPALPPLKNPRLGYPWLNQPTPQVPGDYPIDIGVRWQSLIVSPSKLPWQNQPTVPNEARFAWWSRLRQIPTAAWLSSRDDSERFLYYDGPALLRWPFTPHLQNGQLTLRQTNPTNNPLYDHATQSIDPQCKAWLITVPNEPTSPNKPTSYSPPLVAGPAPNEPNFDVQCSMLDVRCSPSPAPNQPTTYPYTSTPLTPPLGPHFLKELQSRGLNQHEAQALLEIWQKDFFQTKGTRLLLFISQNAYNRFCPLEVTPKPDTLTRVGIIWHELP